MVPTGPAEPLLMASVGLWFTEFVRSVFLSNLSRLDVSSAIELHPSKRDSDTLSQNFLSMRFNINQELSSFKMENERKEEREQVFVILGN